MNSDFWNAVGPILVHVVNPVIELLFAVGILVFAYGVFQVIWGDEEGREAGKRSMWGGVIGMFIMMSAWGIIQIISNTIKTL